MLHGHDLKKAILETIFERFDEWSKPFAFACERTCAFCCTQNVTITAVEAQILLDYMTAEGMQERLVNEITDVMPDQREIITTNQFAEACLGGENPPETAYSYDAVCPFLKDDLCTVYAARPFSCRCFASTTVCSRGGSAVIPPVYLSASTVISQLIEHVAQFNIWGNMLHVLYVLGCETGTIEQEDGEKLAAARACCTTARPLPGFLLDESEYEQIAPLLESIFTSTVDGRTIEDILNNRS